MGTTSIKLFLATKPRAIGDVVRCENPRTIIHCWQCHYCFGSHPVRLIGNLTGSESFPYVDLRTFRVGSASSYALLRLSSLKEARSATEANHVPVSPLKHQVPSSTKCEGTRPPCALLTLLHIYRHRHFRFIILIHQTLPPFKFPAAPTTIGTLQLNSRRLRVTMAPPPEIAIPSTSVSNEGASKPYTLYNITLRLPLRSFVVQKRYSDFATLHSTLLSQVGTAPPAA